MNIFENKEKLKDVLEWVYCIIIAIALALLVRYYIGTPTIVQQPSMFPTLKENQRLLLNRTFRITKATPERGDIVTFEAPSVDFIAAEDADFNNPVAIYNYNINSFFSKFRYYVLELGKTSYIKRVIGLPGDHVEIKDGSVYINGELLEENYLQDGVTTDNLDGAFTNITVPEGHVFVMGDNRTHSMDSRRFGCIPIEKIEGKVWIRFWPLNLFGKV